MILARIARLVLHVALVLLRAVVDHVVRASVERVVYEAHPWLRPSAWRGPSGLACYQCGHDVWMFVRDTLVDHPWPAPGEALYAATPRPSVVFRCCGCGTLRLAPRERVEGMAAP